MLSCSFLFEWDPTDRESLYQMPAESPKNEPELPKLPERPPPLLVTCNGCGGKKLFGTGRLALKKHRGISRLRRQRQRKE